MTMFTRAAVAQMFSENYSQTSFYPRCNETYYPAVWRFGAGAGSASTSCHYDRRRDLAAQQTLNELIEQTAENTDGYGQPEYIRDGLSTHRDAVDAIMEALHSVSEA